MIVARDFAHAKIRERLDRGEPMPDYFKNHPGLLRRPGQDAGRLRLGLVRPDHGGADGFAIVDQFQAAGGSMVMLAKGNRSAQVRKACAQARRLLSRLDRRPGGAARAGLHQQGRGARISRTRHGGDLAHRGRGFPRLHRHRRQGQRFLQGAESRLSWPRHCERERSNPIAPTMRADAWIASGAHAPRNDSRRHCGGGGDNADEWWMSLRPSAFRDRRR